MNPPRPDRPLLKILEACQVVGVSRRTIYNWLAAGRLETIRTAGGSVRIYQDSLFRPSGRDTRPPGSDR